METIVNNSGYLGNEGYRKRQIISLPRRNQEMPRIEGTKKLADTSVSDTLHGSCGLVL